MRESVFVCVQRDHEKPIYRASRASPRARPRAETRRDGRTVLTGPLEKMRGVIGREPSPGEAVELQFDDVQHRLIHMVGVREPLEVTWLADGEVTQQRVLRPWTGWGVARADRVLERPAADAEVMR